MKRTELSEFSQKIQEAVAEDTKIGEEFRRHVHSFFDRLIASLQAQHTNINSKLESALLSNAEGLQNQAATLSLSLARVSEAIREAQAVGPEGNLARSSGMVVFQACDTIQRKLHEAELQIKQLPRMMSCRLSCDIEAIYSVENRVLQLVQSLEDRISIECARPLDWTPQAWHPHLRGPNTSITGMTVCLHRGHKPGIVITTRPFESGHHYWEVSVQCLPWDTDMCVGLCASPITTLQGTLGHIAGTFSLVGCANGGAQKVWANGIATDPCVIRFHEGDRVGLLLNCENRTLIYFLNGVCHGVVFREIPLPCYAAVGHGNKLLQDVTLIARFDLPLPIQPGF
eukprot:TRINITY_DN9038_c0_g2_i2.p1 TRINITY_DN9038_c0_g2~~TRINITY_DN9038_c0_g2_i2.p1  ORF type:complete len:342 (+),score=31.91 TRINITY_DN9038_c0_g2_i2:161-1186(+)